MFRMGVVAVLLMLRLAALAAADEKRRVFPAEAPADEYGAWVKIVEHEAATKVAVQARSAGGCMGRIRYTNSAGRERVRTFSSSVEITTGNQSGGVWVAFNGLGTEEDVTVLVRATEVEPEEDEDSGSRFRRQGGPRNTSREVVRPLQMATRFYAASKPRTATQWSVDDTNGTFASASRSVLDSEEAGNETQLVQIDVTPQAEPSAVPVYNGLCYVKMDRWSPKKTLNVRDIVARQQLRRMLDPDAPPTNAERLMSLPPSPRNLGNVGFYPRSPASAALMRRLLQQNLPPESSAESGGGVDPNTIVSGIFQVIASVLPALIAL